MGWIAAHLGWLRSQRRRLQRSRQAPDRSLAHISFPFPHFGFGKIFPYDEFVVVGELRP